MWQVCDALLWTPFLVVHTTHILRHPRVHRAHRLKSAGLDVNYACKRPISLQKHLYLVCQANLFCDPKWGRDP